MSNHLETPVESPPPPLGVGVTLLRLTLIGLALVAIAGTFAYLGGWFNPNELTPARFADGFEQADGLHPGFRRNHAKGVCVSGCFKSNGNGVRLSRAGVFETGRMPVIGRFTLNGGNPGITDRPDAVRGLGLQFALPNGEVWRTAMVTVPVFPVHTHEAFYEFVIANTPDPATGKPDPAKLKTFLERHPETVAALKIITSQPPSSGFANSTFHGLHAFRFTNAAGASVPARWILTPLQPFEAAGPAPDDKKYLFNDLIAQIHRQPLRWRLIIIVGQPGDPTNDASLPLVLQLRKRRIDKVILAGMIANLCVESHLRELLEQGFEVVVVKDATAGPRHPEIGDGYKAAVINYGFLANAVLTTDEAVKAMR